MKMELEFLDFIIFLAGFFAIVKYLIGPVKDQFLDFKKDVKVQLNVQIPTQISKLEKKIEDMVKENNQNYKEIFKLFNQHLSNKLNKDKPQE